MTLYDQLGGEEAIRRLVRHFYQAVYSDDVLHPLFPEDRQRVEEAQYAFLTQLTGGPRLYEEAYGMMNLAMIHRLLPIREWHARRWIELMRETIDETLTGEARDILKERLTLAAMNVLRVCEAHRVD
ncbi:truncated hemoglobin [Exiguobacterium flavidum]|uniref:truncated hemoglobin n=1 Tax=Exiguobacterium flavidum TaxID=2184695 RepID=UPI000DF82C87|nr:globin [Exiguobacterium flavidum]